MYQIKIRTNSYSCAKVFTPRTDQLVMKNAARNRKTPLKVRGPISLETIRRLIASGYLPIIAN
jgi:hypothetical protein